MRSSMTVEFVVHVTFVVSEERDSIASGLAEIQMPFSVLKSNCMLISVSTERRGVDWVGVVGVLMGVISVIGVSVRSSVGLMGNGG